MPLDAGRAALGFFGAAFATRALIPGTTLWARVGYGLAAADMIATAIRPDRAPDGAFGRVAKPLRFATRYAATIDARVGFIGEQIRVGVRDPKIYALARSVLSKRCGADWCVREKDHRGELTALFNEVRKRTRYTWDPLDYDAFQTPKKTLELHTADCDCSTILLGALLRSVGHPVRLRVVQTRDAKTWNHIYLLGGLKEGTWLPLDASVAQPAGWEVPRHAIVSKRDYDVLV